MEEQKEFSEFIESVLLRVDIVNVISRYLPLKKKGRTLWGCCPFHHEKEPSFAVNEERQFYHCFGCKESGNAITFIQKMESIDFMDALKIVAAEAKMEVPSFKKNVDNANKISADKKNRLLALVLDACKHYNENLSKPEAKAAREYIAHRKLSENIVRRFGLGYSIDGEEMIKYLTAKGYGLQEIREAGIADIKGDRHYDVFYGRLIIPIINNMNEVVGFGGRLLAKETHIAVKYRNTSATPVFDKSKIIFGINLIKRKKQKENIDYVIMTEGYMDVMALHQAGFDTAVASMGTALTVGQAKQLKNCTSNVYISYDGDSAGKKATMRGLDILQECGLNVKVISLPDDLDPDDLIKQRGRDAYQKLIDEADTLTAFKIKVLLNDYDINTQDGKSKFGVAALEVIARLENPVEKEEYLHVIQKYTGYSMDSLRKQAGISEVNFAELQREKWERESKERQEKEAVKFDQAQLYVIASLIHSKDYVKISDDIYPYLTSDVCRNAYAYAIERLKNGERVNPSVLFTVIDSDVSQIVNYEFMPGDGESKYKTCLLKIKQAYYLKEDKELTETFTKCTDKAMQIEILQKLKSVKSVLNQIKKDGGLDV